MYELVCGNVFDEKCDLLILPCNSLGGVTGLIEKELEENKISYLPKAIHVGKVKLVDSSPNNSCASTIGFAASVNIMTLKSSVKYIKSICKDIKDLCKNNYFYSVNVPLLGTGVGGLSPQESFDVFKNYFETYEKIHIKIFVLSKDVYQALSGNTVINEKRNKSIILKSKEEDNYIYDVALSFAGEDRAYVEKIAQALKARGIRVFYDKFEVVNLWGKDLYQYLSHIYKDKAKYCVIFISLFYKNKAWTKHELKNAQNRAFLDNKEYILPIFLEDVELEGLNDTIGYIKASEYTDSNIVDLIIEKIEQDKF